MKKILLLLIAVFFITPAAWAANLDAPAGKVITIRTEAERGIGAVNIADRDAGALEPMKFIDKINNIIDANTQRNTDTDAFRLGVYGQAWTWMTVRLDGFQNAYWKNRITTNDIKFYNDQTLSYFGRLRDKQKQLGLSDSELFSLFLFDQTMLNEWDRKTLEK